MPTEQHLCFLSKIQAQLPEQPGK